MIAGPSYAVCRADHIGFSVASLDDALRFWVEGLGAKVVRSGEMGGAFLAQTTGAHGATVRMAIVSLADQAIELLEYRGPDRPAAPSRPFDPGFAHLALVVDDLDAVLAGIAAYGWKAQGLPQTIAAGPRAGGPRWSTQSGRTARLSSFCSLQRRQRVYTLNKPGQSPVDARDGTAAGGLRPAAMASYHRG